MNTPILKECPFCGATASIIKTQILMRDAYLVECDICKAQGIFEIPAKKGYILNHPERVVTDKQAIEKVIAHWNNRKTV